MPLPKVLMQLNDAVFVIDPRTNRLADANPKACTMLGYDRDELISIGVSAIHPDEIQEFNTFNQKVQAEGKGWTDELRCLTKSGDVLTAEISASMIEIDGMSRVVTIVRPVTESRLYSRYIETQRELAVVEERSRLSREIHDTITQSLTTLVFRLDLLREIFQSDPASISDELDSIQLLATKCVDEIRRSIWDLRPQELDELGLVEAVRNEFHRLDANGIHGAFTVSGVPVTDMEHNHQSAALRIVQEAVSNVIKHSRANYVTVHLEFELESLCITLTDDGVGFEPQAAWGISPTGGGFGNTSMQERARLTGGSLEVQSAPGQGAIVVARIPYASTAPGTKISD